MQCDESDDDSDDDLNGEIDCIIEQDRREKARKNRSKQRHTRGEPQQRDRSRRRRPPGVCRRQKQYNGVKKSKRFSLQVMEAMRAIGREKQKGPARVCSTYSTCEIINYIERHFEADGDVDAQVRTALKQLCSQGFVTSEGREKYCLIGPYNCQPECPSTPLPKVPSRRSCPSNDTCRRRRPSAPQECSDELIPPNARLEESASDEPDDNPMRLRSYARNRPTSRGQARRRKTPLRNIRTPTKLRRTGRRFGAEEAGEEILNPLDGMEMVADLSADEEPIVVPDESRDSDEDEDDGGATVDSGLDQQQDQELKRWIRNCRRKKP